MQTNVYLLNDLRPGHIIDGPAIIIDVNRFICTFFLNFIVPTHLDENSIINMLI